MNIIFSPSKSTHLTVIRHTFFLFFFRVIYSTLLFNRVANRLRCRECKSTSIHCILYYAKAAVFMRIVQDEMEACY